MMKKMVLFILITLGMPTFLNAADIIASELESTQSFPAEQMASGATITTPLTKIISDNLNSMDHAPMWTKFDLSYVYSAQGDLQNSADVINSQNYVNPGGLGSYQGSSVASRNGFSLGFEIGLLLNPSSGIAVGVHYLQNDQYTALLHYPNAGLDAEGLTLLPTVVPITLDYYYFLPDAGGRYFLSVGAGYYTANVRVSQNTTSDNFLGSNNTVAGPDIWAGNLSSGALGFQIGLGREFAINRQFGVALYVKGRYVRITNFQGNLLDSNVQSGNFGLVEGANGVVDVDTISNVAGAQNEHYATIDFTGVDVGIALNFYGF